MAQITGTAYWTYDPRGEAWYFGLDEVASSPQTTHVTVQAVVELDANGRLVGIQILDRPNGRPIEPPLAKTRKVT